MSYVIDSYSETNTGADAVLSNDSTAGGPAGGFGQCFTGDGGRIVAVRWYIKRVNAPLGNVVAKIWTMSGSFGVNGNASSLLATSDPIVAGALNGVTYQLVTFPFETVEQYTTTAGVHYVATIEYTGGDATNYVQLGFDPSGGTHAGNFVFHAQATGGAWAGADTGVDIPFYVDGDVPIVTTAKFPLVIDAGELRQTNKLTDILDFSIDEPVHATDPANKNYVDQLVANLNLIGSWLVSGGGVAWTGTGFNFIVSAATYFINGVEYNSPQTPLTLTAADPTNDRIDVFVVNDDGTATFITGVPGGPPVEPQIDPATQLRLTSVYIAAGATGPAITNVDIYKENVEWPATASGGSINPNSTSNPYAGTKDVEGSSVAAGTFITAIKPSGTLKPNDYATLVLQIRSKATWPNAKSISIFWLSGATTVGAAATLKHGTFGFDSSNVTTYQQITIPTPTFNTGANSVDRLRLQVTGGGGNIGWYIDNIVLQTGTGGGSSGGDFSTNTNVSVDGEGVVFSGTTGKLGKRFSGTGIVDSVAGVLGQITIGTGLTFAGRTLSATSSGGLSSVPSGSTLYVVDFGGNDTTGTRGDKAKPYATIQGAIDDALANDVIEVGAGTFDIGSAGTGTNRIVLPNDVHLRGAGRSVTIIRSDMHSGSAPFTGFVVPGNNSVITDLSMVSYRNPSLGHSNPISRRAGSTETWTNVRVERCYLYGASDVVFSSGVSLGDMVFIDCFFEGDNDIIMWQSPSNAVFIGCEFRHTTLTGLENLSFTALFDGGSGGTVKAYNSLITLRGVTPDFGSTYLIEGGSHVEVHDCVIDLGGGTPTNLYDFAEDVPGSLIYSNVRRSDGTALRTGGFSSATQIDPNLVAVTVANLPSAPAYGQTANVSDGTASLAYNATVTGGGSTKYKVWYNGTAWKVLGGGTVSTASATPKGVSFVSSRTSGILTGKLSGYFTFAYAGTIQGWSISVGATDSGTVTIKFWKVAGGTSVPTSANSINTSGIQLTTGNHVRSTTVTDFTTTAVTAGDVLAVEITAVTGTITDLSGVLEVLPT